MVMITEICFCSVPVKSAYLLLKGGGDDGVHNLWVVFLNTGIHNSTLGPRANMQRALHRSTAYGEGLSGAGAEHLGEKMGCMSINQLITLRYRELLWIVLLSGVTAS